MTLKNSNCDETKKLIMINSKTQIVMKLDSSNRDETQFMIKTQKLKL